MEYRDRCRALHNSIALIPMERCSIASQLILIAWANSRAHTYRRHLTLHYFNIPTCINRSAGAKIYRIHYTHTNINNLFRIECPCCMIICRASCSAIINPLHAKYTYMRMGVAKKKEKEKRHSIAGIEPVTSGSVDYSLFTLTLRITKSNISFVIKKMQTKVLPL